MRLGAGSVDHLIRVAGPDLGSITSELDKLVAYAAGKPLSISEVRTAVAGDEAAGLYETLGELLGPSPAKGAESIDRLLSEGRAGPYLLAILAGQIRDLVLTQAYLQQHGSGAGSPQRSENPIGRPTASAVRRGASPPTLVAAGLQPCTMWIESSRPGEISETDGLRLAVLRAAAEVTAERGRRRR